VRPLGDLGLQRHLGQPHDVENAGKSQGCLTHLELGYVSLADAQFGGELLLAESLGQSRLLEEAAQCLRARYRTNECHGDTVLQEYSDKCSLAEYSDELGAITVSQIRSDRA